MTRFTAPAKHFIHDLVAAFVFAHAGTGSIHFLYLAMYSVQPRTSIQRFLESLKILQALSS